jgi:Tol biopolymer transport system component/DNA-binding winged helix-turn-helix (wHTH) protein
MSAFSAGGLRFGAFRIDLQSQELRKNERLIKLPPQAFRLLALLATHSGELMTRQEIQHQIWDGDTFVDFEHGINKSIRQIRKALGDNAESPKFVETLTRRGYRFIGSIQVLNPDPVNSVPPGKATQNEGAMAEGVALASPPAVELIPPVAVQEPKWMEQRAETSRGRHLRKLLVLALVGAIGALALAWIQSPTRTPAIGRITQITNDGAAKIRIGCCSVLASDGPRVYFTESVTGRWLLSEVSATGGEVVHIHRPAENLALLAISPDRSTLLAQAQNGSEMYVPFLNISVPDGLSHPVGNLIGNDGSWSGDGRIAYARAGGLYVANSDGTARREIASLKGVVYRPAWSPDRRSLRFTVYDSKTSLESLWEVSVDGSKKPRPVFANRNQPRSECCGIWSPDGKYFVYQSTLEGVTSLWALPEGGIRLPWAGRVTPVQLTTGPMSFLAPSFSQDNKHLFAIGWEPRGELMRYDSKSRTFETYLSGLSAEGLDFSRDGNWVVYVTYPEGKLWRSRIDGSQKLQLAPEDFRAGLPRWSPDGSHIAFMGRKPGDSWKIYVVSSTGGSPEQVVKGNGPEFDASWSPDGKMLVFADAMTPPQHALHLVNLETHKVSTLPGSSGMFSPRWSPDGRFIAALTTDSLKLLVFDLKTQKWSELLDGIEIGYPIWSRNGNYIYFCNIRAEFTPFYRVRLSDHRLEHVASVYFPRGLTAGDEGWWTGLAPDDSPLLLRDISVQEIYALDWHLK